MDGELEGSLCDVLENWPLLRELRSLGSSLSTPRLEVLFAVESLGFVAVAADSAGVPEVLKASLRTLDPESTCGVSIHEDECSFISSSSFDLFERPSAASSSHSISSAFASRRSGGRASDQGRQNPQLRRENVERLLSQPCVVGLHIRQTDAPRQLTSASCGNSPDAKLRETQEASKSRKDEGLGDESLEADSSARFGVLQESSNVERRVEVQVSLWPKRGVRFPVELSLVEAKRVRTKRLKRSLKALTETATLDFGGAAEFCGSVCASQSREESATDAQPSTSTSPCGYHVLHAGTAHVIALQELGLSTSEGLRPVADGSALQNHVSATTSCTLCSFLNFLRRSAEELLHVVDEISLEEEGSLSLRRAAQLPPRSPQRALLPAPALALSPKTGRCQRQRTDVSLQSDSLGTREHRQLPDATTAVCEKADAGELRSEGLRESSGGSRGFRSRLGGTRDKKQAQRRLRAEGTGATKRPDALSDGASSSPCRTRGGEGHCVSSGDQRKTCSPIFSEKRCPPPSGVGKKGDSSRNPTSSCERRSQTDFEELRLLGSGGFGSVTKVRQRQGGGIFALKKITLLLARSSSQRARLGTGGGIEAAVPRNVLHEAATLAALNHPRIVRYYDAWIEECHDPSITADLPQSKEAVHLFILMEYCSGRSLREAINAGLFVGRLLPTAQRVRLDADGATETQPAPPVAAPSGPSLQRVDERPFLRSHPDGASSTPVRSGDGGEGKAEEALLARASLWELVILKWRISRELVSALAFMHKFGVIHRDLKPSNIFLKASDDGLSIKVGDFGLTTTVRADGACTPEQLRRGEDGLSVTQRSFSLSAGVGTLHYMAPEQASGTQYGQSADIFSLGVCLFELWALPFTTTMEQMQVLGALSEQTSPQFQSGVANRAGIALGCPAEKAYGRGGRNGREVLKDTVQDEALGGTMTAASSGQVSGGDSERFDLFEFLSRYVPGSVARLLHQLLQRDPSKRPAAAALLSDDFFVCAPSFVDFVPFYQRAAQAVGCVLGTPVGCPQEVWRPSPFSSVLHLLRVSPFSNEAVQTVATLLKQSIPACRFAACFAWFARLRQTPGGALCLQLRQAVLDLLAHHSQQMLICRNATFRTLPALLPCPRNVRESLRSVFKQLNFQQQLLLHHSDSLTRSNTPSTGKEGSNGADSRVKNPAVLNESLPVLDEASALAWSVLQPWRYVFRPFKMPPHPPLPACSSSSCNLSNPSAACTSRGSSPSVPALLPPQPPDLVLSYNSLPVHAALAIDAVQTALVGCASVSPSQGRTASDAQVFLDMTNGVSKTSLATGGNTSCAASSSSVSSPAAPGGACGSAVRSSEALSAVNRPSRWKWFCSGGVCHVMGAAATPMYLPFSLLPAAVAMAAASADTPTAQHPVRRHWSIAATYRTGEAENLYAPLPTLSCSYDMQLHTSTLGSWASSMDMRPAVVSAFVDADVVAAAADVLAPIAAAASALEDSSALLSLVWTCTELLPSLLENAFDVPSECVISFDTWLRVTAAAGQLTYELLLQQLAAIEFCAVQSLEREARGGLASSSSSSSSSSSNGGTSSRSHGDDAALRSLQMEASGALIPSTARLAGDPPLTFQSSAVLTRRCDRLWSLLSLDCASAREFVLKAKPLLAEAADVEMAEAEGDSGGAGSGGGDLSSSAPTGESCKPQFSKVVSEQLDRLLLMHGLLADIEGLSSQQQRFVLLLPVDRVHFDGGIFFVFVGAMLPAPVPHPPSNATRPQQMSRQIKSSTTLDIREVFAVGGRYDARCSGASAQAPDSSGKAPAAHVAYGVELDLDCICTRLLKLQQDAPELCALAVAAAAVTPAWTLGGAAQNAADSASSSFNNNHFGGGGGGGSQTTTASPSSANSLIDAVASWTQPTVLVCAPLQRFALTQAAFQLRSELLRHGLKCEVREVSAGDARRLRRSMRRGKGVSGRAGGGGSGVGSAGNGSSRVSAVGWAVQWIVIVMASGGDSAVANSSPLTTESGSKTVVSFRVEHVTVEQWTREFKAQKDVSAFLLAKSSLA